MRVVKSETCGVANEHDWPARCFTQRWWSPFAHLCRSLSACAVPFLFTDANWSIQSLDCQRVLHLSHETSTMINHLKGSQLELRSYDLQVRMKLYLHYWLVSSYTSSHRPLANGCSPNFHQTCRSNGSGTCLLTPGSWQVLIYGKQSTSRCHRSVCLHVYSGRWRCRAAIAGRACWLSSTRECNFALRQMS